jgi:hypothetical protein
MTKKMTKKALAQALRNLARDYEQGRRSSFTCNAIKHGLGMYEASLAYAATFGFDGSTDNDRTLWDQYDDEVLDDRIMLLCFAAAMAETGDL